jgi:hypothetical protein
LQFPLPETDIHLNVLTVIIIIIIIIIIILIIIIIVPVILYGCQTRSVASREEHTLRVSVNRVFRGIFICKTEEVNEGWRKLHNENAHSCTFNSMMLG